MNLTIGSKVNVRLDDETRRILSAFLESNGGSISSAVRVLIHLGSVGANGSKDATLYRAAYLEGVNDAMRELKKTLAVTEDQIQQTLTTRGSYDK